MLGKCKLRRRMVFGRCFVNFLKNFPRLYLLFCRKGCCRGPKDGIRGVGPGSSRGKGRGLLTALPGGLLARARRRDPRLNPWLGQREWPRGAYCSARRVRKPRFAPASPSRSARRPLSGPCLRRISRDYTSRSASWLFPRARKPRQRNLFRLFSDQCLFARAIQPRNSCGFASCAAQWVIAWPMVRSGGSF